MQRGSEEASDDRTAPADDESIDEQQRDRADDRSDTPRRLLLTSHESRGQEAADERTRDTEKNRDDPAARIASRHEELGDCAYDEAKKNPSDDVHVRFSFKHSS